MGLISAGRHHESCLTATTARKKKRLVPNYCQTLRDIRDDMPTPPPVTPEHTAAVLGCAARKQEKVMEAVCGVTATDTFLLHWDKTSNHLFCPCLTLS